MEYSPALLLGGGFGYLEYPDDTKPFILAISLQQLKL
jgi:hypothetical protein